MAADVVVKMKANVKEYDGGLAKAKKGLDEFVKSNTSLNGLLAQGMTQLTKFAGGFAAAQIAMKGFNAVVLEGSQTTGDFVRNGLGAMQDTLGVLASDIATMDFSNLLDGLGAVYKQALAAREILDSLGDTLVGLGIAGDEARAAIAELREVNSDANSTAADQAAAVDKATKAMSDYKKTVESAKDKTNAWIKTQVGYQGGFKTINADADAVKRLTVLYAGLSTSAQNAYRAQAKGAMANLAEKKAKRANLDPKTMTTVDEYGVATTATFGGGTQEEINRANKEIKDYEQLNKDLLIAGVLFEKNSSDTLKDMAQRIQEMVGYETQIAALEKQLNKASAATPVGVSTPKTSGGKASGYQSQLEMPSRDEIAAMDFRVLNKGMEECIPSMQSLTTLASQLQKQMAAATDSDVYNSLAAQYEKVQEAIAVQPLAIKNGISIDEAKAMQSIQEQWEQWNEQMDLQLEAEVKLKIEKAQQEVKDLQEKTEKNKATWNAVASSVSSVGSALQNVDNKGLNIAGTVMQAVADVALGFAMAMASPAAAETGPWGWIAAAAAGLATMTATIASIKAQTSGSYAAGGMVPGAYNGGMDSTYVYASPGEVILNRAQQENLLSQMDEGVSGGVGYVRVKMQGESLIAVINNTARRRGKGELLFG